MGSSLEQLLDAACAFWGQAQLNTAYSDYISMFKIVYMDFT